MTLNSYMLHHKRNIENSIFVTIIPLRCATYLRKWNWSVVLKSRIIFRKFLIIVECFPVPHCYIIAHAQNTHCSRSCNDSLDFRNWQKDSLYFICFRFFIVSLKNVRPGSTKWCACTLYKQHKCSMFTRIKTALFVQENVQIHWKSFKEYTFYFCIINCSFYFFKHITTVCSPYI